MHIAIVIVMYLDEYVIVSHTHIAIWKTFNWTKWEYIKHDYDCN